MTATADNRLEQLLAWCASEVGAVEETSDHSKSHPGELNVTYRLLTATGYCYLKTHRSPHYWEAEVHAYEKWAAAFGDYAPRLLAVHEEEPRAILVSEIAGKCLEDVQLSTRQEKIVWRTAGQALVGLHDLNIGDFFGPCQRGGSPAGEPIRDPGQHISMQIQNDADRGGRMGYLSDTEISVVEAALDLIPSFEGEPPVPCHRDYCPANWLVTDDGVWAGVTDFEFAQWDVRAIEFARYPDWDWISRPDIMKAFFEGYGRSLTPKEEQQRLVAHVQYALTAVVWGSDNSYYGFMKDGRKAFRHLAKLLR